jgi:MFS family permease
VRQVFAKAGLASPVVGSIIVGAVNTGGTLVAALLMDRAGRRQMLLASHVVMALCLAALTTSTYLPCAPPLCPLLPIARLAAMLQSPSDPPLPDLPMARRCNHPAPLLPLPRHMSMLHCP